jgi:hypothetical protein
VWLMGIARAKSVLGAADNLTVKLQFGFVKIIIFLLYTLKK